MPKPGERWSLLEHFKQDDDLLSFLFIDLGLFRKRHDKERRITRKFNRDEFSINASVVWDSYLDILKMVRAGELSPREGSFKLLKKGTIKTYLQKKRGQTEWNHFVNHVDRYMELCRPDSPFKLFETSRYISPTSKKGKGKATPEATPEVAPSEPAPTLEPGRTLLEVAEGSQASSCAPRSSPAGSGASTPTKREFGPPLDLGVRSLKAYQVHEHLRLYGSAADITSEEDEEMQTDEAQLRADFSVLYNQSKQCVQLFLGPGRFVNHDCNPNVELTKSGKNLCFKVLRPIEPNDEILTFYGSEYFGPNNENCLCLTCKKNKKGAYKKPEKPSKKAKVIMPEDPTARRTRSGHQPTASLRKQVHKANIARTTVTVSQGSRRSARAQTLEASTSSIVKARKAVRREITGTRKRKRSDSPSSEEESENDLNYGSKRKAKAKKPKKGSQKASDRSDSSLTDVEDLDYQVNIETVTFEHTTVELTGQIPGNTEVVQSDSMPGLALQHEQRLNKLISMSMAVTDGDVSSPLSGSTPRDFTALSPAPSESVDEISAPGIPAGFALKLGEQLSSLAKEAGSLLHRALPIASMASDTASQSQSSVFEAEEETKE